MVGSFVPGSYSPGQVAASFSGGVAAVDTLVTISDSIARTAVLNRALTDTLATVTDGVGIVYARALTDTAATVTDSIALNNVATRFAADTLVTASDTLERFLLNRGVTDTLVTNTDVLRRSQARTLTDTLVTMTELIYTNDKYANRIQISGATGSIIGSTQGATLEAGEYRPDDFSAYKNTVWYEWTPPAPGKYRFTITPFPSDTLNDGWAAIYVHDVVSAANLVVWQDETTYGIGWDSGVIALNIVAEAGETYDIQVGAAWTSIDETFPFTLTWEPITLDPAADDFPGVEIFNHQVVTMDSEWATREAGDPWLWIRGVSGPAPFTDYYTNPEYTPSNRTLFYHFTVDQSGTGHLDHLEPDPDGYGMIFVIFDGDGVTDINQLSQSRVVAAFYPSFTISDLTFPVVAGKKYILWMAGEDGQFGGADAKATFRVRWPNVGAPPNDLFENFVDLDDGVWHNGQTTENATHEHFPAEPQFFPSLHEANAGTVWYRVSTAYDDTLIQYRNATSNFMIERYFMGLFGNMITQWDRLVADTIITMSDGVTVDPRDHWEVSDTLTTMSDAVQANFLLHRGISDTAATVTDSIARDVDTGGGGADVQMGDQLVTFSESITRRVTRRISDNIGIALNFGPMWNDSIQVRRFKPRTTSDTITTMSDSVAFVLPVTRFATDTLVSPGDSIAQPGIHRHRSLTDTAVTLGSSVDTNVRRRISDTLATISDGVSV